MYFAKDTLFFSLSRHVFPRRNSTENNNNTRRDQHTTRPTLPVRLKGKNIFGFCIWSTVILNAFPQLKRNSLISWRYSPFLFKWLEILSRFCACREKVSQARARRHNGRIFRRIQVQRSFAYCEHGFAYCVYHSVKSCFSFKVTDL